MEHAIRELQNCRCLYCHKELDKNKLHSEWDSLEHDTHHYKHIMCDCGKKNWVKVSFDCSGHDSLFSKMSPLESTVKKVREKG